MKNLIFLFAASFYIFLIQGCSEKNDVIKDEVLSKTQLLTTGSWNLTALVSDRDANGTYESDDYAGYPACFKDNYSTFRSNGEMEVNEGPTKCSPTAPQTVIKQWQLTNNETTLVVDTDNDLIELSKTTLKIKMTLGGGIGFLSTFTKR